jgi:hypothetical protein
MIGRSTCVTSPDRGIAGGQLSSALAWPLGAPPDALHQPHFLAHCCLNLLRAGLHRGLSSFLPVCVRIEAESLINQVAFPRLHTVAGC